MGQNSEIGLADEPTAAPRTVTVKGRLADTVPGPHTGATHAAATDENVASAALTGVVATDRGQLVAWARETHEQARSENTARAHEGDLRQFWNWVGSVPMYPISVETVLGYVHAYSGKHRLTTIARRLASLSKAHQLAGASPNPCRDARLGQVLSDLRRLAAKEGVRPRKMRALTADLLERLLATCANDKGLIGTRDGALLLVGWASGGRRRSELAALRVGDIEAVPDKGGYLIHLRRSKTDQEGIGATVPVLGRAAEALRTWLEMSGIHDGSVFRSTDRSGQRVKASGIASRDVERIIRKRAKQAGLDPTGFGGHSLRSGFITEAGRRGIPSAATMALSGHRSTRVFNGYYQSGDVLNNPAAVMLGE